MRARSWPWSARRAAASRQPCACSRDLRPQPEAQSFARRAVERPPLFSRPRRWIEDHPKRDGFVLAFQFDEFVVSGVFVNISRVDIHRHQQPGACLSAHVELHRPLSTSARGCFFCPAVNLEHEIPGDQTETQKGTVHGSSSNERASNRSQFGLRTLLVQAIGKCLGGPAGPRLANFSHEGKEPRP